NFNEFLPSFSIYVLPFHINRPVTFEGRLISAPHWLLLLAYFTAIVPRGCCISPLTFFKSPRRGSIFTFENPGASLSIPNTILNSSIFGLAPQAWQSERALSISEISAHFVIPISIFSFHLPSHFI